MKFSAHILTILSIVSFSGCLPAVPEAPDADTMTTSETTTVTAETGSTTNTDDCWAVAIDNEVTSALVGDMTEVPRSVELWVYLQEAPANEFPFFTLLGSADGSDDGLRLRVVAVGSKAILSLLMSLADGQGVYTDQTKLVKEWHHVAMEHDGDDQWSLYVDGHRSYGTTTQVEPQFDMTWTDGLRLGNRKCSEADTCMLRLMLDEIRFSNEARYSKKSSFIPSTRFEIDDATVGLWHFDEGEGATAHNSVDGGAGFSLEGNATWTKSQLCDE